MTEINGGYKRYRSRTFWMVNTYVLLATGLTYFDKIEGAGWITVILGLFAGWQIRRAADNRLAANGGK